ncbi:hypothetical protein MHK07_08975, partial [Moraxella nonliquefaciens]|nr:hypothetical protein [Moraxella nonliquefaciens]
HETNDLYRIGIHAIKDKFALHSITCDGRWGLLGGFGDIPTKKCLSQPKKKFALLVCLSAKSNNS